MRCATELLTRYAAGHRDQRNILSHFVGVPMIVLAMGVLLSRPAVAMHGVMITPAWIAVVLASAWYMTRGNLVLGLAVSITLAALMLVAHRIGGIGMGARLAWGVGLFVFGGLIQSIGHWYEGKKSSRIDDVTGLLISPMFVVAEALFMLGWNKQLAEELEQRVGPTVLRDAARIA